MVDMTIFTGAFHALKTAGDLTKLIIEAHDASVMRQKAIELQPQIISAQKAALDAQSEQFTLLGRIRDLEKQVAELEAWDAEKGRYELIEVGDGALAYSIRDDARGVEPPHWICAACYQRGKKSILQITGNAPGDIRMMKWTCSACTSLIYVPKFVTPSRPRP